MQSTSAAPNPAIQIRLQGEVYAAVEKKLRRNEPDIPTRPEAVRRLHQRALEPRAHLNTDWIMNLHQIDSAIAKQQATIEKLKTDLRAGEARYLETGDLADLFPS